MVEVTISHPRTVPRCSPLMDHRFLEAVSRSNLSPINMTVEDGRSKAYLGGVIVKPESKLVRKTGFYNSLFFFTGPFLTGGMDIGRCVSAIEDHCIDNGYCSFTILPYDYPIEEDIEIDGYSITRSEEFFIDLTKEIKISRTLRHKSNRAKRNGLVFDVTKGHLGEFLDLLDQTRLSRKIRGYSHFNKFWFPYVDERSMRSMLDSGIAKMFIVMKDDEILSANFVFIGDVSAYGMSIGTSLKGYEMRANVLIFTEGMEYLRSDGITTYNIGGFSPKEPSTGLVKFKRSLGAQSRTCIGLRSPFLQGKFLERISKIRRGYVKWKASRR